MRTRISLRFRPSLIIFVGESGTHIRKQLQDISHFAQLDPILYQSIALLEVAAGSDQATQFLLEPQFITEDTGQHEGMLAKMIENALKDVQANKRIQEIINAGYPIPNPRTQIYIVGSANESWMAHTLQVVHQRLEKSGFSTLICYVLSAYAQLQQTGPLMENGSHGPLIEEITATSSGEDNVGWSQRDVANYCYLYEDMLTYPVPTFVREFESHHAAAEALFTFIATGLTTTPFFEEMMHPNVSFSTYENVGSLSTSLISFPREALLEYSSARLGVALMEQWLRDIQEQSLSESKRKELQQRAKRVADDIESWIIDSEERPLANGLKGHKGKIEIINERQWPNLSILKLPQRNSKDINLPPQERSALNNDHARLSTQLEEETIALFELFWSEAVKKEYKRIRRPRFDTWTKMVYQQAGKSLETYKDWEHVARQAWEAASTRVNADIKSVVDELWSGDDNGFEQANIYVSELDAKLSRIADHQSHWREAHERDYEEYLSEVEHIAHGVWIVGSDDSNIINSTDSETAQASPTRGRRGVSTLPDAPGATGTIIGAAIPMAGTAYQHLPAREERLAYQLELRIHWLQDQLPEVSTQITIAVPFILSLVLATLAWGFPTSLPVLALIVTLITLLVTIIHVFFHSLRQHKVQEAKEDLLIFYRRYYAYQCEKREDRCRTVFMGPLRRKVQSMRDKLEDLYPFIQTIQHDLEERATATQQRLFNSPGSVRDIFVANGERLQKEKKNTLEDFAGQITKLRVKEPIENWHQTPQEMKKHLIILFRRQHESLIEMNAEQALRQIYEFTVNVNRPYFKGPLVDLQSALDKEDIWREALDRIENPLYRAQVGIREPQFRFICGRTTDISRGIRYLPSDAYPVQLSDVHEWVLLAAFFRGGLPRVLDIDTLFPHKADSVAVPTHTYAATDTFIDNEEDEEIGSVMGGDDEVFAS